MKTKQQIKEKLYKSYFIDRKRNNTIAFGLFISLIIAIISAIVKTKTLGVDLMVFGLLGLIVFIFTSIWCFFIPYDSHKKRTKIYRKIDELEVIKNKLQKKFNETFDKEDLKDLNTEVVLKHVQARIKEERKIDKIQEKLCRLEFEIEMLGGPDRISLKG